MLSFKGMLLPGMKCQGSSRATVWQAPPEASARGFAQHQLGGTLRTGGEEKDQLPVQGVVPLGVGQGNVVHPVFTQLAGEDGVPVHGADRGPVGEDQVRGGKALAPQDLSALHPKVYRYAPGWEAKLLAERLHAFHRPGVFYGDLHAADGEGLPQGVGPRLRRDGKRSAPRGPPEGQACPQQRRRGNQRQNGPSGGALPARPGRLLTGGAVPDAPGHAARVPPPACCRG